MFHRYFFPAVACAVLILSTAIAASAQSAQLRGHVVMKDAAGKLSPVPDAIVDVFRVDVSAKYEAKTNKRGQFIWAGLPVVGEYIVAVSKKDASPSYLRNVKAGREIDYEVELIPGGDGKRYTLAEIKAQTANTPASGSGEVAKPSAEEIAKRAEMIKKNKEIIDANAKNESINTIVNRTFKAGNDALTAKQYDEAIKQYQEGLAADPEQGALYSNLAAALRKRGAERFNATLKLPDDQKTAGFDAAKQDFRQAAETAQKAVQFTQKEEPKTDAASIANQNSRKLFALSERVEAMKLFVPKVDPTQADAGITAYNEYIAAQPDAAKKITARMELAQMLVDAGAGDKAILEYQKILAEKPDDPDAILGAGFALYSTGDKAKFQEAANYLQRFVDKAPDSHPQKDVIKAVLVELKNSENIVPEKTVAPPRRRRP